MGRVIYLLEIIIQKELFITVDCNLNLVINKFFH